ncbi:VWA domain-containing protein [Xanthobacter sp. V4C-4]|uniref:vWA domain-containing protein n=1 Tax=Xanthobacter cornucopiae TaxID=3119924 RepID=UPI0037295E0F
MTFARPRPRSTPWHRLVLALLTLLALAPTPAGAADVARTVIILDGSGSMWGVIDGRRKLAVARETVDKVMASLPADREVGLMAYGHRRKNDCADIELVVPPAPGSGPAVREAVKTLRFLGMTPLSAAVKQAAEALRFTEAPATVVLVTDGIETCEADPCALAGELKATGVDFTAHVIGFGLTREEGAKVACIADKTGGRYLEARDAATLDKALTETVLAAGPAQPEGAAHYPGAPLMPNVALHPTGRVLGKAARPVTDQPFAPTGTIAQCQAACAADAACAAWRYEPRGSQVVDHARCVRFDAAAELEINTYDPSEGWASGIKDGQRPLARPYRIAVTFQADGADAPVTWSALPLPGQDPPAGPWTLPQASAKPVQGQLLPGTYDVLGTVTEGPAAGTLYTARVRVRPAGETAFVIPRAAAQPR